jgi:hypothetical protein
LTSKQSDLHAADLAASLQALANALGALGHWERARQVIEAAVKIFAEEAARRPDRFEAELAGAKNLLAAILRALGHSANAFAARQTRRPQLILLRKRSC